MRVRGGVRENLARSPWERGESSPAAFEASVDRRAVYFWVSFAYILGLF